MFRPTVRFAFGLAFASLTVRCSLPAEPAAPPGAGAGGKFSGASGAAGSGSEHVSGAGGGNGGNAGGGSSPTGGIGPTGGSNSTGGGGSSGAGGNGGSSGGSSGGGDAGNGGAGGSGNVGGGNAGSGGNSSGGGNAGSGGSGGAPLKACPSGTVFCDDFESYAEAAPPPAPRWKSWTVGNGSVLVDSARGHNGGKAAHFHGKVSQTQATKEQAFMQAQGAGFPVAGPTIFVRFMMYATRFPFTGFSGPNHVSLAWVGSAAALDSPDRGEVGKGYMLADYNGVSIEPMWDGYFRDTSRHFKDAAQQNTWHCWEFEIDNAGGPPPGATGAALPHIWEDGAELRLTQAGGVTAYAAIPFERVMFALWSPQTDSSAGDFWIDDVAVSKSRIGCP